jgi:hypothetical protein
MKTYLRSHGKKRASVLILTMVLLTAACMVVGTYMGLAMHRAKIAARSASWNQALAVAEAGIEEGLAQIQYSMPPTNAWTFANGLYVKTRSNPFGSSDTYFTAAILNTNTPVITATGYVKAPVSGAYIKRVVQVMARKGTNQFPYGIHVKGTVTFSGSAQVDSYDSLDPNYSISGRYDPLRHKDNVHVVSQSGANKAVQIGNGKVFGYVETGPGVGVVTVGGGAVGDNNYVSNSVNAGTVQMSPDAHALTNYNMDIVDVQLPSGLSTAMPPVAGSYNVAGTNYTYCLGNVTNCFTGNFSISGGQSMVVTGRATLYVTGNFTLSGSAFMYLTTNAYFTMYVGTTNVAGNDSISVTGGGIANGSGYATHLAIYGLPSVKTATYSGNSVYIGTGDAPNASTTISGSAGTCGSIVGSDVTISGSGGFHWDESQGGEPYPKYTVVAWREL